MDAKAKEMVDEAYERTLQLLTTRKEELVKVAELLMLKVRTISCVRYDGRSEEGLAPPLSNPFSLDSFPLAVGDHIS